MVYLLIRQQAKSFPEFKRIWDREAGPLLTKWGCLNARLCQVSGKPEEVVVIHAFDRVESVKKFLDSDEPMEKIQSAGVLGNVETTILESVEYKDFTGAKKVA
jgi:heme-degrading monooxygenase HmoA